MEPRRALVPYHFGHRLDLLVNRRAGDWTTVAQGTLYGRLAALRALRPDLVVGGDCMNALAAYRPGLALVWVDAHGDFHTLRSTETGRLGGMPLAMLRGLGDRSLLGPEPPAGPPAVYHLGGSALDAGEGGAMEAAGVRVCRRLDAAAVGADDLHLHIDTDAVRPDDLPGAFHPSPAGASLRELFDLLDALLPRVRVLSIKSPDPRRDPSGRGAAAVGELLRRYEYHVARR